VIDTRSALRPGQKVKVKAGPFADLVGTLDRLDNAGRAKVLLEIMSGERCVSMAGHDLQAL
jgi:transcription termination/antitermination protein NusG